MTDTVNGRLACFIGAMMMTAGLFGVILSVPMDDGKLWIVGGAFFLTGTAISVIGVRALNRVDEELRSIKLNTLHCPYCDMKLEELEAPTPSGDTHQCLECGKLYAPYRK